MKELFGLVLSLVIISPASAQEPDVTDGRDLFEVYCWQCHGIDASGNGPMAEMFAIETPDLTLLSKRNAGVFPTSAVAMQIDGRSPMLAHGGEMPIFGPLFESGKHVALSQSTGQPLMTGLPLANIVVYLQSIQKE